MKNLIKIIKDEFSLLKKPVATAVSRIKRDIRMATFSMQAVLASSKAEGYVDSGIKILISVVIGALLLGGLYALFNTNIIPTLTTKINGLFNYAG